MRRRYLSMNYVYTRTNGLLELRYPIPVELQVYFPKRSGKGFRNWIGGSLGTRDTTVANQSARNRIERYEKLFSLLSDEINSKAVEPFLRYAYEQELKRDEEEWLDAMTSDARGKRHLDELRTYLKALRTDDTEQLEAGAGWLADMLQDYLSPELSVPRGTAVRRRFLDIASRLLIDVTVAKIARATGSSSPTPKAFRRENSDAPKPGENIPLSNYGRKSVVAYFDEFLARWQRTEPRQRTIERRSSAWSEFCEVVGPDTPMWKVSKSDIWRYHEYLMDFPARANSRSALKGKSFLEQVRLARAYPDKWPNLDANTVGDRLRHVGAVFRDAVKRGDLNSNPAEGVSEGKPLNSVARPAYSSEELNAILSLPIFKPAPPLCERGEEFWVPLLELFTGARPSELYLPIGDVREDDEIPHFLLEPFKERSLKTPASARWVPIHSDLIKAGFLDYCRRMRKSGAELLFPDWDFSSGSNPSEGPARRRFNRMVAKVVDQSRNFKDSYTFRATFDTAVSNSANVSERLADRLLGRTIKGSARYYVDRLELSSLKAVLEEVTYPGVDRSHLYVRE